MLNLDFSQPNRLITLTGIGTIFLSIAFPFMVMHESDILNTPQAYIDSLPKESRQIILLRIRDLHALHQNLVIISVMLLLAGLLLTAYGLANWNRQQRLQLENSINSAKNTLAPAIPASQEEVALKQCEESATCEHATPQQYTETSSKMQILTRPSATIKSNKEALFYQIDSAFKPDYQVESTMSIGDASVVDILLNPDPNSELAQVAIEIVTIDNSSDPIHSNLSSKLLNLSIISQQLKTGVLQTFKRGPLPPALHNAVIIYLINDGCPNDFERATQKIATWTENYNRALNKPVAALCLAQSELESIDPARLRQKINTALAGLD